MRNQVTKAFICPAVEVCCYRNSTRAMLTEEDQVALSTALWDSYIRVSDPGKNTETTLCIEVVEERAAPDNSVVVVAHLAHRGEAVLRWKQEQFPNFFQAVAAIGKELYPKLHEALYGNRHPLIMVSTLIH